MNVKHLSDAVRLAVIRRYLNHVDKARELLDQALLADDTPRALACLYEAVVAITQAINELEKPSDQK